MLTNNTRPGTNGSRSSSRMMKKWHSCFDRFSTNGQSSTTRPYTNFEIKCVCPGIDGHGRPLERKLKIKVNKNGIGYMPTGLQRVKSFEGEENKPDIGEAFFMARECMLDANGLEESARKRSACACFRSMPPP